MSLTSYTFSQLMTFARASVKWLPGSAGILVQTASGSPAFSYDPVALSARGLSLEGASSNIAAYSSTPGTEFVTRTATVTANAGVAPDGTSTAASVVPSTTSGSQYADSQAAIGGASNVNNVVSIYLKPAGYFSGILRLFDASNTANDIDVTFNLTAMTAVAGKAGSGNFVRAGISQAANGWYRVWVAGMPNPAVADNVFIRAQISNASGSFSFAGDGTSGILIWGSQIEPNKTAPSSHIVTVASSAGTRAADACSITSLSPWFNAGAGTFYVQARIPNSAPSANNQVLLRIDDGTDNNKVEIRNPAGTSNIEVLIVSGGATVFQQVGGTFAAGTVVAAAVSYASNAFGISVGGNATISGASGAVPQGVTRCILGASDLAGSNALNGELQDVNYYPVAMSATDLQALT
jgi:hypothetical protein